MLESTGVPLPGETILLAAGVLVERGDLDLGYTIAFVNLTKYKTPHDCLQDLRRGKRRAE